MSTLSVVIPTYTINKDLEDSALMAAAIGKLPGVSELIICEDGGMFSPQLSQVADMYLYSHDNAGFTKNVNKGIKLSHGDYIAVINSDISFSMNNVPDLTKLCIPGKVTSPMTAGQDVPGLAGHFFVIPRTVLDDRGYLNEAMEMFCSDAEYEDRVKDIFQQVPEVRVYHEINKTLNAAGIFNTDALERDREIYSKL